MKIKATFIGTDRSLGYLRGVEYSLTLDQDVNYREFRIKRVSDGSGECVYSHAMTFFKNWTLIKTNTEILKQ